MAQKIFDDKIGTLSHSAGNITMAASLSSPAYLTIGGQQYTVTSNLSVALPALTAAARYQVYAVQSAGVVSLVISGNENSVGPASQVSWKLIGSVMANAASPVAFGSFINIEGKPASNWMDINPAVGALITAVTSNPTFGTVQTNKAMMMMDGDQLRFNYNYRQTTAGSAGTGAYLINLPVSINTTLHPANTGVAIATTADDAVIGEFNFRDDDNTGAVGAGIAAVYSTTQVKAFLAFGAANNVAGGFLWNSALAGFNNANIAYYFRFAVTISGWTTRPIKDL